MAALSSQEQLIRDVAFKYAEQIAIGMKIGRIISLMADRMKGGCKEAEKAWDMAIKRLVANTEKCHELYEYGEEVCTAYSFCDVVDRIREEYKEYFLAIQE